LERGVAQHERVIDGVARPELTNRTQTVHGDELFGRVGADDRRGVDRDDAARELTRFARLLERCCPRREVIDAIDAQPWLVRARLRIAQLREVEQLVQQILQRLLERRVRGVEIDIPIRG